MFGIMFVRYPASIVYLCHMYLITSFKILHLEYRPIYRISEFSCSLISIGIGPKNPIITFCSSFRTDSALSRSSTPPQFPSLVAEFTPVSQPYLPSSSLSSSPTALHAKVELEQNFGSSRPSDRPPQLSGPLPVASSSISHTQPPPQSQPQRLPSDKGSRLPQGPTQASHETLQQPPMLNPATLLPGSVWCM